ncbi:MAG: HIT family protein [Glaciecola sp.]
MKYSSNGFQLDHRLENDSFFICQLDLCQVRLINDAQFVWLLLVPMVNGMSDVIDLDDELQQQLWRESSLLSRILRTEFVPDKLNIAAIGNVVSQLHVHHICRFKNDIAWPAPVWGRQAMVAYEQAEREGLIDTIKRRVTAR